ncbi:MAG TPA: hypothetical protein VF469_30575 [Kofleriaceae bacterium]
MISGVVELGRGNDARLSRLRTVLALGTGFQLILVEAEPGPIRKEVIRRILTWSGHDSIAALALVCLDADATLAAQLGGKSGAIVTGLEPASPADAPARDWTTELNWTRDALPELVPGPVILVVSGVMHRALFEQAPDLYSWRRHTAQVTVTVRDLAAPLSSPEDRYWLAERDRLSSILADDTFSSIGKTAVLLSLADVLFELGDEPGASRVLDEAALSRSSQSDVGDNDIALAYCDIGRAECALVRGDLAAARQLIDRTAPAKPVGALLRGKLYAADGAWDAAVTELELAIESARLVSATRVVAHARECLCQVALTRGDVSSARREIANLIEAVGPHMDEWGTGMLLRLARATAEVYPDEIVPLLDAAFVAAEASSSAETVIRIHGLRAKRAWSLGRIELAQLELTRAKLKMTGEEPGELKASWLLCHARVALAAGTCADDEISASLTEARERFRPVAPKQAAVAGALLGEFWRCRRRTQHAIAAYRIAADDARAAGDLALAAHAELGELGAAMEGEIEQEDVCDRLRALAERFRIAEQAESEGIARAYLGRCWLRRGLCDAAVTELERARACFVATTDAARERSILDELAAMGVSLEGLARMKRLASRPQDLADLDNLGLGRDDEESP